MVWVSGQVALDPSDESKTLVGGGDVIQETEQCLKNVQSVLQQCKSSMSDVLKVNIYCTDMSEYGLINEVYGKYFDKGNKPPARACVQVKQLPLGAKVEMCVVAVESEESEANL